MNLAYASASEQPLKLSKMSLRMDAFLRHALNTPVVPARPGNKTTQHGYAHKCLVFVFLIIAWQQYARPGNIGMELAVSPRQATEKRLLPAENSRQQVTTHPTKAAAKTGGNTAVRALHTEVMPSGAIPVDGPRRWCLWHRTEYRQHKNALSVLSGYRKAPRINPAVRRYSPRPMGS